MKLAVYMYGLASIATGAIDIAWHGFESAHQPIQAFGDAIPGREIFAYVIAALLIAGGAAVLRTQTAKFGAVALGVVYTIFTIFWLPRLYTAPHALGLHAGVVMGVLAGVCQPLIVAAAALLIYTADTRVARWIFGISSIVFGLAHLTGISVTAAMVPKWMPPGQDFWAVLTGVAFALGGVAILIRVLDVLAARLLAVMLLVFSAFALLPVLVAYPHNQIAWGSNAYNLAAIASMWILACRLEMRAILR
jgi:uncharacterized membrane protein